MASKRPATIPAYIAAAPRAGQPHLRRLYRILKEVAPKAQETIKWGTPFFVEPRFLFAFSAHKAHLSFAPSPKVLEQFRAQLEQHDATRHFLRIPYDQPIPAALLRRMARQCVKQLSTRKSRGFW